MKLLFKILKTFRLRVEILFKNFVFLNDRTFSFSSRVGVFFNSIFRRWNLETGETIKYKSSGCGRFPLKSIISFVDDLLLLFLRVIIMQCCNHPRCALSRTDKTFMICVCTFKILILFCIPLLYIQNGGSDFQNVTRRKKNARRHNIRQYSTL